MKIIPWAAISGVTAWEELEIEPSLGTQPGLGLHPNWLHGKSYNVCMYSVCVLY